MKGSDWKEALRRLLCPAADGVVGINRRNLGYIYPNNSRQFFSLADDKVLTKEVLVQAGLPVPATLKVYRYFFELQRLQEDLAPHPEFVVKPAGGGAAAGLSSSSAARRPPGSALTADSTASTPCGATSAISSSASTPSTSAMPPWWRNAFASTRRWRS